MLTQFYHACFPCRWDQTRTDPSITFDKGAFDVFSSNQKVMFLDKCLKQAPWTSGMCEQMDRVYGLSTITNCEVKFRWQWLALQAKWEPIFPAVTHFITTMGRMKYVRPLYRALVKCGENGRDLARSTFLAHRDFYHPICVGMVAKDLGL
jgi:hypothetical protein